MFGKQIFLLWDFFLSFFGVGRIFFLSSLLSPNPPPPHPPYKLQMEQENPLLLYMCVQSGSLKPTWGFFRTKPQKNKNQKKKKAVAYILYDQGSFQTLLMMGCSCQFLFLKTLFNIRQTSQEPFVLVNQWGSGNLRGMSFLKRTQLRVEFFSFPTNEAKWVSQKLVFSEWEHSRPSLKMCPGQRVCTLSTPCRIVGCSVTLIFCLMSENAGSLTFLVQDLFVL